MYHTNQNIFETEWIFVRFIFKEVLILTFSILIIFIKHLIFIQIVLDFLFLISAYFSQFDAPGIPYHVNFVFVKIGI